MLVTSMYASPTTPPKNVARNHTSGSLKDPSPRSRTIAVQRIDARSAAARLVEDEHTVVRECSDMSPEKRVEAATPRPPLTVPS